MTAFREHGLESMVFALEYHMGERARVAPCWPAHEKTMPSFDIVSKTEISEVDNALDGVTREIGQRYDFKGSHCSIERKENELTLLADDDLKLKQMHELLVVHFTRRKLDPGALDYGKPEKAAGDSLRQVITVKQGIDKDLAKKITKAIKDSKMKVQASIQGDELRVTGKKIDDLQAAISMVKGLKIEQPLQYINFRD
jgi:uncharacterized protein YajQ (UPF0234 family)